MAEGKPEIDPVLESVLLYCLKDARERMQQGENIIPFSALAVGETLFMEEHPGNTPAESYSSAQHVLAGTRGAKAYGFCYDGYINVDTDDESNVQRDCLIAEGGTPGAPHGHAVGQMYTIDDEGNVSFNEEVIYVGKALNYMVNLTPEEDEEVETEEGATETAEQE